MAKKDKKNQIDWFVEIHRLQESEKELLNTAAGDIERGQGALHRAKAHFKEAKKIGKKLRYLRKLQLKNGGQLPEVEGY